MAINSERYSKFVQDWKKAVFPARPSKEEMPVFDELMRGEKEGSNAEKQLLILGATPEFRDLGAKHKLKVTCADLNPNMLEGMKELMTEKPENENLVQCNWLNLPFENRFDLAIAEQSINIVPLEQFEPFLLQVKKALKHGGKFVLKAYIVGNNTEEKTLEKFRERNHDIRYLKARILDSLCKIRNGQVSVKESGEHAERLMKEGKITKEQHDQFRYHFGAICDGDLYLYILKQTSFEELLRKHFRIKKTIRIADQELHENHPIYVLEK